MSATKPEKLRIIKREDAERASIDDDLRRLVISMARVLKRRYPDDFRRIMAEMNDAQKVA